MIARNPKGKWIGLGAGPWGTPRETGAKRAWNTTFSSTLVFSTEPKKHIPFSPVDLAKRRRKTGGVRKGTTLKQKDYLSWVINKTVTSGINHICTHKIRPLTPKVGLVDKVWIYRHVLLRQKCADGSRNCLLTIFHQTLIDQHRVRCDSGKKKERIHFSFPPPEHVGWVRWGWVRKEGDRYWELDTDPALALSVLWDIPRCDGVGKPLKKNPHLPGLEPGTSRM
jgi:hypothetical protein